MSKTVPESITLASRANAELIAAMTEIVCQELLPEPFQDLCRKMVTALERLKNRPLQKGDPNVWAAGVLRVIAVANGLSRIGADSYLALKDIDACLSVSSSAGAARASMIRKLLKVKTFDQNWAFPERLAANPNYLVARLASLVNDLSKGLMAGKITADDIRAANTHRRNGTINTAADSVKKPVPKAAVNSSSLVPRSASLPKQSGKKRMDPSSSSRAIQKGLFDVEDLENERTADSGALDGSVFS